jgi:type VI secretion system protein VasJ
LADGKHTLLGTSPIPGDKPAGVSCRYEPEFDALNTEVEKLGSLTGAAVDWRIVEDNAVALLSGKSKDLLVAAYLARTLYETEGMAGLGQGFGVVRDLMKNFWDGLFPEAAKPKARASALQWLSDKMSPLVEKGTPDPAAVQPALDAWNEISAFAASKFDAGSMPALQPLQRALEAKLSAGGAASAAAPAGGDPARLAGGAPSAGAPAAGALAGPVGGAAEAYRRLEEVRDFFKRTEPHNPVIYLIDRALRWRTMSLQDVVKEMLPDNRDIRNAIWQQLGIEREHD